MLIIRFIRLIRALINKAPFIKKEWYNYQAMIPRAKYGEHTFIECFDKNGKYISCPNEGGTVVYNIEGKRYLYQIIGFKNSSRYSDWLYDTDYINPVIQFVKPIKG